MLFRLNRTFNIVYTCAKKGSSYRFKKKEKKRAQDPACSRLHQVLWVGSLSICFLLHCPLDQRHRSGLKLSRAGASKKHAVDVGKCGSDWDGSGSGDSRRLTQAIYFTKPHSSNAHSLADYRIHEISSAKTRSEISRLANRVLGPLKVFFVNKK